MNKNERRMSGLRVSSQCPILSYSNGGSGRGVQHVERVTGLYHRAGDAMLASALVLVVLVCRCLDMMWSCVCVYITV